MGEVIDVRAHRFLQEMREHGSWKDACVGSGMSPAEVERLCTINPKFDLAQVEAQLEHVEGVYASKIEAVITKARADCFVVVNSLRRQAMLAYRERHKED